MVDIHRPPIHFHLLQSFTLSNRTILKKFLVNLFKKEGVKLAGLNYIFCSDSYLLNINQQYLKHNDYTDIITFPLSRGPEGIFGEIYISIDRVRENARTFNTSFTKELHRVIFHGALHLCGYKDKRPKDKQAMTKAEDKNLQAFFRKLKQ
jgi:rRNA maturation RNase YbeY